MKFAMKTVKTRLTLSARLLTRSLAVSLVCLLMSTTVSAQKLDKVIPTGEWAEPKVVSYSGGSVGLQLRTGYERIISFPEPISLHSLNNRPVTSKFEATLPGCAITIDGVVMTFSPLQTLQNQTVAVLGNDSGIIYELLVSSSPLGSRQPLEVHSAK